MEHVGHLAARAAERWPDRVFAVLDDEQLTFAQLAARVDAAAAAMRDAGVGLGDRVLVHLPNGFEVIVLQLAAWRLGAISVPVVPIYREHELRAIVTELQPALVAAVLEHGDRHPHEEFDRIIAGVDGYRPARWLVGGGADGWLPVPHDGPSGDLLPCQGGADDCCLILYTSGTTSAPKGARLTSTALHAALAPWIGIGIGSHDVALAVAPLAHIAGLNAGALLPLTVGCRSVIMRRWNPDAAIPLIDRHRATISCGAAVFLQDLVDRYETCPPETHRLSHFVSGGSPTPPELVRRAERAGMRASRSYGMTETAGVITLASADDPLERRACYDGRIADAVEIRVLDDGGHEVSHDVPGALRIAGPQLLLDYTDPDATAIQLRDGWFDPGDLAAVTADGWLRITGRTKDIINRGGEKFSARDIEEAVLDHPAVSRVAVTAVPDRRLGETVGAWIVLASGHSWNGPDPIVAHLLEAGLAKAKIPVEWHVLDAIPMTPSGKVQKHLLAALRTNQKEHTDA